MEAINSLLQRKEMRVIVGAAVVITGIIPFVQRFLFKPRRKVDIPKYPRNKVILFQFPRGPYAPSLSPFALKLETYLRMASIPYQNVFGPIFSSSQKTPFILYGGTEVADTYFCIEHLNRVYRVDLNYWLSDEQRAVARAFQMMVEDHLFWVVTMHRWFEPEGRAIMKIKPGWRSALSARFVTRRIHDQTCAQGMGKHTKEEALSLGEGDIRAVSKFLGKKPFLMGDQPCEEDCSLFGMLAQVYWQLSGPLEKLIKGECCNLGIYCERMKDRFWPDWKDCITHGRTTTASNINRNYRISRNLSDCPRELMTVHESPET